MVAGIEKRNILVVDDERQITRVLKTALSSRGYSIRTATDSAPDLIAIGDFRIDLQARSVCVKEREVRLTPKEFDLLLYLARHPGKVMTHRALLSAVWGENSVEQPAYLRVFIGHLRKKLEPDEGNPRYIMTDPWIGYRFEPGE